MPRMKVVVVVMTKQCDNLPPPGQFPLTWSRAIWKLVLLAKLATLGLAGLRARVRLGPTTCASHGSWLNPPAGRAGRIRGRGEKRTVRNKGREEKGGRGIEKEGEKEEGNERHKLCFIISFINHSNHLPIQMLIFNITNRKAVTLSDLCFHKRRKQGRGNQIPQEVREKKEWRLG